MLYIGTKLRSKRDECKMKQETLAKAMNIPQTTLSRIENNKVGVSEETLQKLAVILETTTDELKESAKLNASIYTNPTKANGHTYTNHNTEVFEQALSQFQDIFQQMQAIINELKADKEFLREENLQLRHRDEKWMQMIMDMQTQLVNFLGQHRG
ncbi:helix-turn-helix transcriptional regulator [Runella sp. MFBS21]|uniref:helix-turn-helix domain-containing protein n=1 Tax=Runella sp. MFBS21 TaxID=3034018 RepID=UPI0023F8BE30|nr:helix-turn-helix transcriptional regulator [Runella sp. MFBS21]MDF7816128.1 helix-turn-helix transcriptional regulator [Runella sp. MFBS21]